jgi:hypothetical protein
MDGRNQKLALKVVAPWGHTWVGSGTTANTSWVEKGQKQTNDKQTSKSRNWNSNYTSYNTQYVLEGQTHRGCRASGTNGTNGHGDGTLDQGNCRQQRSSGKTY